MVWICLLYGFRKLLAAPQDGHVSEEIEPSERNGKKQEVSLSAISPSPVLPSLDSTDWKGTARSLWFSVTVILVVLGLIVTKIN